MTKDQQILFVFYLFLLIFSNQLNAQNSFEQIENLPVFSPSSEIINGEQWVYQKKYEGHPFWNEDVWYNAYIIYHGKKYENISMRYDIHTKNIIILKKLENEMRAYTLNKEFLHSFAIIDKNLKNTVLFNYKNLTDSINKQIYYHAYNGASNYYIIYKKSVNNRVSTYYTGEYIFTPQVYAEINGNFTEFRSNSEFLKLFGEKKPEIKKYMRQNNIKYKKQTPESLIPVFSYYESISNPAPSAK